MPQLRPHLQSAKDAYRRARYPGDLASEVLGSDQRLRPNRWLLPVGFGGGAVAAAVGLLVMLSRPSPGPSHHSPHGPPRGPGPAAVAQTVPAPVNNPMALAPAALPGMPTLPAMPDWSAVPALPAMPAMPTMSLASAVPMVPPVAPEMAPRALPGWLSLPIVPAKTAPPPAAGSGGRRTTESKEPI